MDIWLCIALNKQCLFAPLNLLMQLPLPGIHSRISPKTLWDPLHPTAPQ